MRLTLSNERGTAITSTRRDPNDGLRDRTLTQIDVTRTNVKWILAGIATICAALVAKADLGVLAVAPKDQLPLVIVGLLMAVGSALTALGRAAWLIAPRLETVTEFAEDVDWRYHRVWIENHREFLPKAAQDKEEPLKWIVEHLDDEMLLPNEQLDRLEWTLRLVKVRRAYDMLILQLLGLSVVFLAGVVTFFLSARPG